MLKKTIKYTDYNDVERNEDFYFNLSKSELVELEASVDGGLSEYIQKIVKELNPHKIMDMFKNIILLSYGVKSDDGKRFIKSEDLKLSFYQSEAYSNLLMELASDADAAAAFINGIVPKMPNKTAELSA